MSQRAYARHRGVALSAVQKAIETGRISTLPDGQIDSEQADVEWEQNTRRHAPPVAKREQEDDDASVFGASQYTKARAVREHYQARLAKIEYEERDGEARPEGRSPGRRVQQVPAVPRSHAEHPGSRGGDGGRRNRSSEVLRSPDDRDPEGAE